MGVGRKAQHTLSPFSSYSYGPKQAFFQGTTLLEHELHCVCLLKAWFQSSNCIWLVKTHASSNKSEWERQKCSQSWQWHTLRNTTQTFAFLKNSIGFYSYEMICWSTKNSIVLSPLLWAQRWEISTGNYLRVGQEVSHFVTIEKKSSAILQEVLMQ